MVKKTLLKNGVRVLTEQIEGANTAAVGVFVKNGSVDENSETAGISHFIEHMLFKGTKSRSAREIAILTDRVGGNMNAYTTKEYTAYYAKVLSEDIDTPIELLSDMYFNSLLSAKDIKVEKNVILEEINMYEDSPEDLVCDMLFEEIFEGHDLARSILGTKETVKNFSHTGVKGFLASRYTPENTVVSVAGRFDEEKVLKAVEKKFSGFACPYAARETREIPYRRVFCSREKEIEQNHLCFGFPGLPFDSEDSYALAVLSALFGGGMSSRLFQKVREEKGLCYGIYSFSSAHEEAGLFAIHVALAKKSEKEALAVILDEIKAAAGGFSKEEIEMGKHQVRASFLMGLESVSSRMQTSARREILKGEPKTPGELLEKLERVTQGEVNGLSKKILAPGTISLSLVGDLENSARFQDALGLE